MLENLKHQVTIKSRHHQVKVKSYDSYKRAARCTGNAHAAFCFLTSLFDDDSYFVMLTHTRCSNIPYDSRLHFLFLHFCRSKLKELEKRTEREKRKEKERQKRGGRGKESGVF